jgi:hypothetical protein
MFFLVVLSMCMSIVLLFFYQNIAGAITHYNYDGVDEHRFTLRADTDLFSLFQKSSI